MPRVARIARYALLAALALPAFAAAEETVVQGEDRVIHKRRTTLDFGEKELTGELQRPEELITNARHKAKFASLVRVRATFTPELQQSARGL